MSNSSLDPAVFARRMIAAALALTLLVAFTPTLFAQQWTNQRSVGGISVDVNGILDNATLDNLGLLARMRAEALDDVPGALGELTELRKISLRRLEAAIEEAARNGKELPDEIKYLAGLQQIRYVFVYPELNDIVLAGPGEGWKVDKRGNVVGATTGRPVMLLDDLLVALRTARQAARGGISCSIDPTAEGLTQLRGHVSRLTTIGNPTATATGIEQALGPQQISIEGVPATSHFARVLVAADYRMKRLAMNFEPSPVAGLPSFLNMMTASGSGMSNMLPRWWLEPNYQPLLRDASGLAFEFRGASVKAMTEEDFLTAAGDRQHTGKANPVAQRWADNMTAKYDELAVADPIFGQLRNCMELAVVGALIVKERLPEKAGYSMPTLLDPADVEVDEYFAPKQVDSQASVLKKGRNWVISASGGVMLQPWAVIEKTETADDLDPIRTEATASDPNQWWWN